MKQSDEALKRDPFSHTRALAAARGKKSNEKKKSKYAIYCWEWQFIKCPDTIYIDIYVCMYININININI